MRLEQYGPWAAIAGGSEGVGAAFALKLAAAGINVLLIARKPGPLEEVASQIRSAGSASVRTLSLDLATADAAERVKAATDDVEVGLLIYNAGAESTFSDFVDRDVSDATRMIARNITVPTVLAHHFGGRMRARGRGGIILVGSTGGYAGGPTMAMYTASKAFDYILAEGLWYELRPHGVHVLGLVLGATDTPAMARMGMKTDTPGFVAASPESVAQEGLEQLAIGPIWHSGGSEEFAQQLRTMPRADAVRMVAEASEAMLSE